MKKNLRVPVAFGHDPTGDGQMSMVFPVTISLICHLVFLVLFVVTPSLRLDRPQPRSVLSVSMVSLKTPRAEAEAAKTPAAGHKTPAVEKPAEVPPPKAPVPEKKAPVVEKNPPKPKTSLKKKTFKSTQVVKQAIRQLEEKVDAKPTETPAAASPEALKSALERLRQQVDKTETARTVTTDRNTGATGDPGGQTGAKLGSINENGKRTAELIDLYRLEVAFQIQKNWAFNEQLAGGDHSLVSAIVFKVMPNGEIRDIFFTDRSGNDYLDESAYKAIVKSNPVDGHPAELHQPYVVMAIRFTPQGVR